MAALSTITRVARARLAVRVIGAGQAVARLGQRALRAERDHHNDVVGWALIGCAFVLALAGEPLVRVASFLAGTDQVPPSDPEPQHDH
jgi:hypothetical protein